MTNTILRIEIKDYLVFRGDFAVDFCPGINVFIGGNGSGKTTLLRSIYSMIAFHKGVSNRSSDALVAELRYDDASNKFDNIKVTVSDDIRNWVYIPEKDILEHAKGLLTFMEQKETGFGQIYKDILIRAMDVPTREQSSTQRLIGEKIVGITGGEVKWDKGDGSFYTMRPDGVRVLFANEASGFKKFGFLGLLVASGQLEPGSILLWDEPENSLNPELFPTLVDILFELQRSGVQIFIATHSELLANELSISQSRKESDEVKFFSLYKEGKEGVKADSDSRFDLLQPNKLMQASVEQYEREVKRGLGGNE